MAHAYSITNSYDNMLSTSCLYFLSTWPYVPQHPCRLLRWRYWQTRARGLICLCLQAPVTLPSLENLCYKRKASGHLTSRMLGNHQWHIFISRLPMYSNLSCLRHRWALPYELPSVAFHFPEYKIPMLQSYTIIDLWNDLVTWNDYLNMNQIHA